MSFYVTSQSPKPGYDCYPIKNWAKAGLQKQSVVRLDKMLRLQPDDVQDFIGHLSDIDIMLIELELARIANRSQWGRKWFPTHAKAYLRCRGHRPATDPILRSLAAPFFMQKMRRLTRIKSRQINGIKGRKALFSYNKVLRKESVTWKRRLHFSSP